MTDQAAPPTHPITHRRVLKIAFPIVLANLVIPLQGVIDTAVVGQIPSPVPIAAVALGAVLMGAILWIFGFLRMGTAGLTAQAAGAGDRTEVAALLTRALMIGGVGGLLLIGLLAPILAIGFWISPASTAVQDLAAQYMWIRIWAAPAAVAVFAINGWLVAQERTRDMLALQIAMVAVNISLNILFVLGFGWGVPGVALSTVIADVTGLATGLWLCRAAFRTPAWRDWPRVFDRARLRVIAVVNVDILIRSLALEAIFLSFVFYYSAGFGDTTLAASHVLLHFIQVTAYALDGFAFAAEALVGQAFGARAVARLRRAVVVTSLWGFVSNFAFALTFALAGGAIIDTISKDPGVQQTARQFLPWIVAMPVAALPAFMLDGIFIGATRTRDMRNMMLLSMALYFAAATGLIALFGAHGMWAALLISFVARGATLGLRYPALERAAAG